MVAYYNEIDKNAAAWLRELIRAGLIPDGVVDERSIEDVKPSDLAGFTQCHFFAGIGVWAYALRSAGIPDDMPVWTGSCPCQSFSVAGAKRGMDDVRHLWPAWHHLIRECKPPVVFGEQVEKAIEYGWLDLVQSDLENEGYAFGAIAAPSAGFGAPHIRQRLFFVADRVADAGDIEHRGRDRFSDIDAADVRPQSASERAQAERVRSINEFVYGSELDGLADTSSTRPLSSTQSRVHRGEESTRPRDGKSERRSAVGGMGDTDHARSQRHGRPVGLDGAQGREAAQRRSAETGLLSGLAITDHHDNRGTQRGGDGISQAEATRHRPDIIVPREPFRASESLSADGRPCPTNGFWRDADWLYCQDKKWRPVEPGTFPLVDGSAFRVVAVCSCCQTETRWINGKASETNPREALQILRTDVGEKKKALWRFGERKPIQSAQVLFSEVLRYEHVETTSEQNGSAQTGAASPSEEFMQSVWFKRATGMSSQRQKPIQQYERERRDFVLRLPPENTSQEASKVYLRDLQKTILSEVTSEPYQVMFCAVCQSDGLHLCQKEVVNRTIELRGYGNAINAEQATDFITAFYETKGLIINMDELI